MPLQPLEQRRQTHEGARDHEQSRLGKVETKAHLKFVASQPRLVCGREPSDPHHLRFAQPRAIGLKVSDEFTVPLCRGHHRQLHQAGNEIAWWDKFKIDALRVAQQFWEQTHPSEATSATIKQIKSAAKDK